MKWDYLIKITHFTFLAFLILFILSYYFEYKPEQDRRFCTQTAAREVLNSQAEIDAYDYYQQKLSECLEKLSPLTTKLPLKPMSL